MQFLPLRTYLDVTKISIAHAVAISIGYAARRPLPWLACNVARACAQIPFKVQFYVAPQVYLAKTLQGRHKEIHRPGYTVLQIDG